VVSGGRVSEASSQLTYLEAPIPGTNTFEDVCNDAKWSTLFHFGFHNCPDLPEALTKGRERIYIKHFWDRLVGPWQRGTSADCSAMIHHSYQKRMKTFVSPNVHLYTKLTLRRCIEI
jgi:hypothetical protein